MPSAYPVSGSRIFGFYSLWVGTIETVPNRGTRLSRKEAKKRD